MQSAGRERPNLKEPQNIEAGQERIHILESMPVNKAIWTLAIPTMTAMLIQVIYNMTDTFFIGKLNDPHMVAAIAISIPVFLLIQGFGNVFAVGGASLISRLLGKGEEESASQAGAIAFWSALTVCSIVSVIFFLFTEKILQFCGASVYTLGFGKSYLKIMFLGGPFIGTGMVLAGLLRSEGATREAMIGITAGSILNMVLDPIFILLLNMGVSGAAIATVIGNVAGFLYLVAFYLKKKSIVSISRKHYSFDREAYTDIFKIGIPASVGFILMSICFAVANVFAAGFGDDVVAANGVIMRVTNLPVMLVLGLAQGCQPLLGYSYGAQKHERLFATLKRSITIGTIMSTIFAFLFIVFPDFWIRTFINDPTVINLGVKIIRPLAWALPFLGVEMILMTMFQSLGKTVESLVVSLGRQGLFFVPALYVFSSLWGFNGFVFALPFADVATTLLSVLLFLNMRKNFRAELGIQKMLCGIQGCEKNGRF
jgi:multidrug efflux pump